MRKKKKDLEALEEEMINISNKEQEILESYNEEFIEYNEKVNYEDDEFDYKEEKEEIIEEEVLEEIKENNDESLDEPEQNIEEQKKSRKNVNYKIIINVCFTIIMVILSIIAIDVISVARYDKGPFFAIPIKEYRDGGTKEYLGIGYKVIDYNQIQGRKGKEIGTLSLKYNTEPINIEDIDLAIEFTNNEEKAYIKYYKKYIKIESTVQSMDLEKSTIKLGYKDEDGKYTLNITCNMADSKEELVNINVNEKTYITGTVKKYEFKTKQSEKELILDNCFVSK